MRVGRFTFKTAKRMSLWAVDLVEHETANDINKAVGRGGFLAFFRYGKRRSRFLGSMHVAKERANPYDVIHEAVHVSARAVHTINRLPISKRTEEMIAQQLEEFLPLALEFYGYEIIRKEKECGTT